MFHHHSCPKCGSGWVHQQYCNGHSCKHYGFRGCGPEHLRLSCAGCGYSWNVRTLDHPAPEAEPVGTKPRVRKPLFAGDEGAPKLPTMHRRERWSTPIAGNRRPCSSAGRLSSLCAIH